MIKVKNYTFNTDVENVLTTLREELFTRGLSYFKNIKVVNDYTMTNCPYHKQGQELKPSCGFHNESGFMHCFSCGEKHSLDEVITFLLTTDGITWLLNRFSNFSIDEDSRGVKDLFNKEEKEPSHITSKEYQKYRMFHPYMFERKLTEEVIKKYDIGFDEEDNTIVFPQKDFKGRILFLAKRSVKNKMFSYPKGSKKPIYGLYEVRKYFPDTKELIICESMLDALYFVTINKPAVALNGLGNAEQIKELNSTPYRKIILCTDMDEPGINARHKIKDKLVNKFVYQYILPEGRKDANDCTVEELKSLVPVKMR